MGLLTSFQIKLISTKTSNDAFYYATLNHGMQYQIQHGLVDLVEGSAWTVFIRRCVRTKGKRTKELCSGSVALMMKPVQNEKSTYSKLRNCTRNVALLKE